MAIRGLMENNRILLALNALKESIEKSILNDQQRNAIKVSIDKLINYYNNKMKEIDDTSNFYVARNKEFKLTSIMIDYIVAIDYAIKGINDCFNVANAINKTVNRVEKKKILKK